MRKLQLTLIGFLCSVHILWAQLPITGKVTDKNGAPVAGATITLKNSKLSTVSDANGSFSLSASQGATLVVSHVSFATSEVNVTSGTITVQLNENTSSMSEVVVVGYGTRLKKDVTSSISRISNKDFQNLPLPSFETALQGRSSGVFINSGSGKLGQGLKIRVRGISSISANQQPFVVIDGVPVVTQSMGSYSEPDNPLATINPDDIESMEVLKDAAASAIYGARASNGVLLITTKSGKAGKTKVNFGSFTGWSRPTKKQKFLNAAQYRELFTAAATNRGWDIADEFKAETGTDDWMANNDVNWSDLAFQNGGISQYSLSLTGGTDKTKFLISGSWNDQKGIIIMNRLNRGTFRLNLDHSLNNKIKIGSNISLMKSKNFRVASDNAFSNPLQLNALSPLQPLYDADGNYNPHTYYYNILLEKGNSEKLSTTYRTISSIYGEYAFLPELVFRTQAGLDWNNLQEEYYEGPQTLDGAPGGLTNPNRVNASVFTATHTLNFRKAIGTNSTIDALAGMETQQGNKTGVSAQGKALPNEAFKKIASAAIIEDASSPESGGFYFESYFLRSNFKYLNRYLVGASLRMDGSSRFGKDNRYGFFPSVSAGWIVSEESFLKNSNTVSYLKLRGSYGKTGNAEIGDFSARTLYEAQAYADISGLVASQIGEEGLKWERTDQIDMGLDFGFWNNRLTGEVDFFKKNTKDLLLDVNLPAINGYTDITRNIGNMENKGWELVLNGTILTGKLKWTSSVNISTYKNKVTKLVAPVYPGSRTVGRLAVGSPYGEFFGKRYAGADPANGDALYYNADGSTTNSYANAPDMVIGNPNPDFYGGFNNHFSYSGFDLDVQCQFVKGGDLYNIAGIFQSANGRYFDNQTIDQMNYWKKPGDVTDIPQPRLYKNNGAGKSSRWVQDGSYFRVKSVNFGYAIPRRILSKAHIDNARIYVAASNLFTFTKYKGYDPEINTEYTGNSLNLGHDFYTAPQAKTISIGINVSF